MQNFAILKTGFVRQSSRLPEVIHWFYLNTRSAFPFFIILLRLRRSISEIMKLFWALEVGLLPIILGKSSFPHLLKEIWRTLTVGTMHILEILASNVPCDISGLLKLDQATGKYDFGDYKIKMATGRSYDRNMGSPNWKYFVSPDCIKKWQFFLKDA